MVSLGTAVREGDLHVRGLGIELGGAGDEGHCCGWYYYNGADREVSIALGDVTLGGSTWPGRCRIEGQMGLAVDGRNWVVPERHVVPFCPIDARHVLVLWPIVC